MPNQLLLPTKNKLFTQVSIPMLFLVSMLLLPGSGGCHDPSVKEQSPLVLLLEKVWPNPQKEHKKLLANLSNLDADLRREGVRKLCKGKSAKWPQTAEILDLMAQGDPDSYVREEALKGLASIGDEKYLKETLKKTVNDPSEKVRVRAVEILGHQKGQAVMELLLERLKDDQDGQVRAKAAEALANFRDRRAVRGLLGGLIDEEFKVTYRSRQSLRILTGEDFEYDQQVWQDWLVDQAELFAEPAQAETGDD